MNFRGNISSNKKLAFLLVLLSALVVGCILAVFYSQRISKQQSISSKAENEFPLYTTDFNGYTMKLVYESGESKRYKLTDDLEAYFTGNFSYKDAQGRIQELNAILAIYSKSQNKTYVFDKGVMSNGDQLTEDSFSGFNQSLKNKTITVLFAKDLNNLKVDKAELLKEAVNQFYFNNQSLENFAKTGNPEELPLINGKRTLIVFQ